MSWLLNHLKEFRYRTVVVDTVCLDDFGEAKVVAKSVSVDDQFANMGRKFLDIILYSYLVLYFVVMVAWIVR